MTIPERIADRQHVGASDLALCRVIYFSFKPFARRNPAARSMRKAAYRAALARHHANQRLYAAVIGGRL